MGWKISKEFDFCYGHRVHNQELKEKYSIDSKCVCRFLHGHHGYLVVNLSSEKLVSGMVTDFKHLNFVKKHIDQYFDHKLILDISDPIIKEMFSNLYTEKSELNKELILELEKDIHIVDEHYIKKLSKESTKELYQSLVLVNFVPTSENLARYFYNFLKKNISELGVKIDSVILNETSKSSAEYYE